MDSDLPSSARSQHVPSRSRHGSALLMHCRDQERVLSLSSQLCPSQQHVTEVLSSLSCPSQAPLPAQLCPPGSPDWGCSWVLAIDIPFPIWTDPFVEERLKLG